MNVLVERGPDARGRFAYGVSNVEYTVLQRHGISDEPVAPGSSEARFPANTNVLYIGLEKIQKALERSPRGAFPGMLVNLSKPVTKDGVRGGRLETSMQNIADALEASAPTGPAAAAGGELPTAVLYSSRAPHRSAKKKRDVTREPSAPNSAQTRTRTGPARAWISTPAGLARRTTAATCGRTWTAGRASSSARTRDRGALGRNRAEDPRRELHDREFGWKSRRRSGKTSRWTARCWSRRRRRSAGPETTGRERLRRHQVRPRASVGRHRAQQRRGLGRAGDAGVVRHADARRVVHGHVSGRNRRAASSLGGVTYAFPRKAARARRARQTGGRRRALERPASGRASWQWRYALGEGKVELALRAVPLAPGSVEERRADDPRRLRAGNTDRRAIEPVERVRHAQGDGREGRRAGERQDG